ncbi:PREDICTED: basic leucine zipper and W2 domain-containing protein 1-like [Amphimedon queenslandica]|uniref:W2 domain-containing protein n=1 Tax=Amphimedon queenslandica TaxID=400682 RepID=A0AAN0IMB4_AMPQE|nr:PREDICTED: basic leucine zipper and W2 domain-containing protein 1-like [Amphimedon queenslandica]|eukprot:XP_011404029.1 PREDICTED: basic leucine zipper and W2 domain-containing protein 1-like [Amphimedon queenslandica]
MCAAKELPTLAGSRYKIRKRDKKKKYALEEEHGVRYETKNTDEKALSEFDTKTMDPLPTSSTSKVKNDTKTDEKAKSEFSTPVKEPLPVLNVPYKFKTRKRDEKVKYDAESFADTVISKLNETDGSPEALSTVLAKEGETLDYRRYAESLLEILIAGGILAPGGKVESDQPSSFCVFLATPTVTGLKLYLQVLTNLLRRYRYLQKQVKDTISKVINYLKAFTERQRQCLAIYTALCITEGILTQDVINNLFLNVLCAEHLMKEDLGLSFTIVLFRTWIEEKGIINVGSVLRKTKLENQLLNILPLSRRTEETFDKHFTEAGLHELVTFRKAQQNIRIKKKLKGEIDDYLENETESSIIIDHIQEVLESSTLTEVHTVTLLWKSVMDTGDWSKVEGQSLIDQLEKHLEKYSSLFYPFCERGTPQLMLMREIQSYCAKSPVFINLFPRIILNFYKKDLISEQAILKWHEDAFLPDKKDTFLSQMNKMVEWLKTADEESDDDHHGQ